jgi:hypothetical protein
MHLDALEAIVPGRDEDPVAVMQVQHGRRGYDWAFASLPGSINPTNTTRQGKTRFMDDFDVLM